PVAVSWLKSPYPQPPVFGNRLLSFSIRKACVGASGTSTTKGASVLFLKLHWSFAIFEPSGKGLPLPGTPALYALIMFGLATITLSTSSVRAEETTAQSSYPLKSENAIPLGDFSEYLSCAEMAVPIRTTSGTETIPIASMLLRVITCSLLLELAINPARSTPAPASFRTDKRPSSPPSP